MTYQVIPSRDLIRRFREVMERLIQGAGSVSFSYKNRKFKIIEEQEQTPMSRMLEKLRANSHKQKVDTTPYETKEEIYSNRYD